MDLLHNCGVSVCCLLFIIYYLFISVLFSIVHLTADGLTVLILDV